MVVDDVGKVVGGKPVGFEQDLILQLLVFHGDIAEGGVMEGGRALVRDALADDEGFTGLHTLFCLRERQSAAGTDVLFDLAGRGFALVLVGFLAEAVIRAALFAQQLCVLAEQIAPLGLHVRPDRAADVRAFVMLEMALLHRPVYNVNSALNETPLIRVLNAENELALIVAGNEIGIERGTEIADVHVPRGRRGEPRTYLARGDALFHILKPLHVFHFVPPAPKYLRLTLFSF